MKAKILLLVCGLAVSASSLIAQQPAPTPIIVQAITPGATTARPVQSAPAVDNSASTLKQLEDLKATNAQILEKQAATLQQLEEIAKAAEQLKIYSKRG